MSLLCSLTDVLVHFNMTSSVNNFFSVLVSNMERSFFWLICCSLQNILAFWPFHSPLVVACEWELHKLFGSFASVPDYSVEISILVVTPQLGNNNLLTVTFQISLTLRNVDSLKLSSCFSQILIVTTWLLPLDEYFLLNFFFFF